MSASTDSSVGALTAQGEHTHSLVTKGALVTSGPSRDRDIVKEDGGWCRSIDLCSKVKKTANGCHEDEQHLPVLGMKCRMFVMAASHCGGSWMGQMVAGEVQTWYGLLCCCCCCHLCSASGGRYQGHKKTEKFLPVGAIITVIGELARNSISSGMLPPLSYLVRPPSWPGGPFFISNKTITELHMSLARRAGAMKVCN